MEFGVGIGRSETPADVIELARLAEGLGYAHLTCADQQNLWRDVYVMLTIAALHTTKIRIGQGVTVPGIRHPSVTANATASLDEVSAGRAFLAIGAGGNALRSMGRRPPPLQELRETVEFCREFFQGKEVAFGDDRMHSDWIRRDISIYVACRGPKSFQLAGEIADGVIMSSSVHPEVVKWRMELIEKGARKAGRDPSTIDVWQRTMVYVADSKEDGRRETSAYAARGVWQTLGMKGPEVDELRRRLRAVYPDLDGLLAEAKRVHDAYDEYAHETTDAPHGALVTQRMRDFQFLTGPADEIRERIRILEGLGVRAISCATFTIIDKAAQLRAIHDQIMPAFRGA